MKERYMLNRKAVVVDSVTDHGVAVRYGTGLTDIEWLTGIARPNIMLSVGDRGSIVWRKLGSHSGMWVWETDRL